MKITRDALHRLISHILVFTISFVFISCDTSFEPNIEFRGGFVSSKWLATIDKEFIKDQMDSVQLNLNVKYDVDVYKIVYYTVDTDGNLTIASGALFIPIGGDNLPLMSLHHGTQAKRNKVASVNPWNSPEGFIGAGLGYYTLVPDYLGMGESKILHPYLHAKSSANAVIDFIRVCKNEAGNFNINLNGQIFLAGYSEGGYVTLAAHREIQLNYSSEITVTASAPMAGPYDLFLTSQTILQNTNYDKPSYIAYLAAAYDSVYNWNNLHSIFSAPYANLIPSLIDGSKTVDEIDRVLTHDLTKLFTPNFLTTFSNGTEVDFSSALRDNSLIDWTPAVPVRFYHGNADQFVPYENSVKAKNYFNSHGANVELITIEGGDHLTSVMPSIVSAIDWFERARLGKSLVYK